ncbi:hypothetical protein IWQ62_001633 [Dispira parvispora]|uniref:Uncharacterized protein n=1 Tax=Dispira parvispora TaxID=1520584 RepID=A0A9W8AT30_9FUNG|nr:hypothetical protein IWQ62_001633 [Dispira parvispora]
METLDRRLESANQHNSFQDDHEEADKPELIYTEMPIDPSEVSSPLEEQVTKSKVEESPDDAAVSLNYDQESSPMGTS